MKLISINSKLLSAYSAVDDQIMLKEHRPVVLIVRLKYRDANYDFAVPLRSNIPPAAPKDEYFALPPRKSTKPKHRHGLHYIKMFPVTKKYYERYRIDGDIAANMYLAIIDKNEKQIVNECQAYLDRYASGKRALYSTDLDRLIGTMNALNAE